MGEALPTGVSFSYRMIFLGAQSCHPSSLLPPLTSQSHLRTVALAHGPTSLSTRAQQSLRVSNSLEIPAPVKARAPRHASQLTAPTFTQTLQTKPTFTPTPPQQQVLAALPSKAPHSQPTHKPLTPPSPPTGFAHCPPQSPSVHSCPFQSVLHMAVTQLSKYECDEVAPLLET